MAWDDPSPRARARSAGAGASTGYGVPEVRLSFSTIVGRALLALLAGVLAYAAVHAVFVAWQGRQAAAHSTLGIALPLLLAVVLAWLCLRVLLRRPEAVGLPRRIRDGGGWWRGRRSWDDGYGDMTLGQVVAADVVGDVVGAMIDAAID